MCTVQSPPNQVQERRVNADTYFCTYAKMPSFAAHDRLSQNGVNFSQSSLLETVCNEAKTKQFPKANNRHSNGVMVTTMFAIYAQQFIYGLIIVFQTVDYQSVLYVFRYA